MVEGGRRARQSEKTGEGKIVSAFTRMLVTVSGCRRCGLNWYLIRQGVSQITMNGKWFVSPRRLGQRISGRANNSISSLAAKRQKSGNRKRGMEFPSS